MKFLLGTDLDMTLLHNGLEKYDGSLKELNKIIILEEIGLVYVTGRNKNKINEAIKEYCLIIPDFIISQVGTVIYKNKDKKLTEDEDWTKYIASKVKAWDVERFSSSLEKVDGIEIQEKENMNQFKLSYYFYDMKHIEKYADEVKKIIEPVCSDAQIIPSFNEKEKRGFIDIIPKLCNKVEALNYIVKKLGVEKENVVYSGDSGNDMDVFLSEFKSIIVKNSPKKIKEEVKVFAEKNNLVEKKYFCTGTEKLNGNYSSGIIEGLLHFKFISRIKK